MVVRKPIWRRLSASASFFWIVSLLPAEAPPAGGIPPAVWDVAVPLAPPSWFGPVQSAAGANMTVWRAPIRPPPGQSRLAVTLLFEESQGGFARLIWQGPARAVTLCGNLYEAAAPLHARTLIVDRETLGGAGQLVLEATGTKPVLVRAELSWVEPLVLAASGWTPPGLYLAPSGKLFPADELHGQGRRIPQDENKGHVTDAVLDAGPVKIRPGTPICFIAPLSSTPSYARVEAQVAGLGPGEEPTLWINGRPAAAVAVQLPSLEDAGYRWVGEISGLSFGGWRVLTALVPPGWLSAGENQLEWRAPPESAGLTIRNLRLQVSYDPLVPARTATPPPWAAVPAAPAAVSPGTGFLERPVSSPRTPQLRLGLSSASGGVGLRSE